MFQNGSDAGTKRSVFGLWVEHGNGVGVLHVPQGVCLNSYDVSDTFIYIYTVNQICININIV